MTTLETILLCWAIGMVIAMVWFAIQYEIWKRGGKL